MTNEEVKKEETQPAAAPSNTEENKKAILKQVEYYLGDYSYPRDKFLQEEASKNDGWIPLSTMLKCKRLAQLTTDPKAVLSALETSELVKTDPENERIQRDPAKPITEIDTNEIIARTVYVKNFPKDGSITLDTLMEFFEPHGPVDSVQKRNFFDRKTKIEGFKGSVFVVFKTLEAAKKLFTLPELKYNSIPLIRKWRVDYDEEKKAEFEERANLRKMKEEKREKEQELIKSVENVPINSFLHISEIPDDVSREDIRAAIGEITDELAFFGYRKGEKEGYCRFSGGKNKEVLDLLKDKLKFGEKTCVLRLVEGEEEEVQRTKALEAKKAMLQHPMGHKRKKFGGQRNFRSKRPRVN